MVDLYYRQQGEGADLIMLHGLFGSCDNLGMLTRVLANSYKVTSVDLRDHGRSPHTDEISYPVMAEDILSLMDTLEIPSAAVFGHSMGGKVVMQMAAVAPDRITKMIVGDIAPIEYGHNHVAVLTAQEAVRDAHPPIDGRKAAEAIMDPFIEEDGVLPFLLTNLRRDGDRWQWRHNLDLIVSDYPNIAKAPDRGEPFGKPVLFMKGANSAYITEEARAEVAARYTSVKLHVLSGTGHWFHAEKPEATLRVIEEFLASDG